MPANDGRTPKPLRIAVVVRRGHEVLQCLITSEPTPICWRPIEGTPNEGEAPHKAAARILLEQTGLIVPSIDLAKVGEVELYFGSKLGEPAKQLLVFAVEGDGRHGELKAPHSLVLRWHDVRALPSDYMGLFDLKWLRLVLDGNAVRGHIVLHFDGSSFEDMHLVCTVPPLG